MAEDKVILSFGQLRDVVMATSNQGQRLKTRNCTVSHSDLGKELDTLALKLDRVVADSDPSDTFIVMSHETYMDEHSRSETIKGILRQKIDSLQKSLDSATKITQFPRRRK